LNSFFLLHCGQTVCKGLFKFVIFVKTGFVT
jgi:hypothetical protein